MFRCHFESTLTPLPAPLFIEEKNSCLIGHHLIESLMTLESSVVPQQFIRTGHVLRLGRTYFLGRLTGFRRAVYYSTHPACNCYKISPRFIFFFLKPSFHLMPIRFCVVPNIARGATRFQVLLLAIQLTHSKSVNLCKQDMLNACAKKKKKKITQPKINEWQTK